MTRRRDVQVEEMEVKEDGSVFGWEERERLLKGGRDLLGESSDFFLSTTHFSLFSLCFLRIFISLSSSFERANMKSKKGFMDSVSRGLEPHAFSVFRIFPLNLHHFTASPILGTRVVYKAHTSRHEMWCGVHRATVLRLRANAMRLSGLRTRVIVDL